MSVIQKIQKNRYKDFYGYKFDRWIFQLAMFLIFAYLFYVGYSANFNLDYYYCEQPPLGQPFCENPFYKDTWKNQQFLDPGEYGNKPGLLFNLLWPVAIGGIALALVLNHLVYNRKFELLKKLNKLSSETKEPGGQNEENNNRELN